MMSEDVQSRPQGHKRFWLVLALAATLLTVLILPPLVSVSRYKSQITHLMATTLGRPVRLSLVEMRLLPRPGFVLTDLTVDEDPTYGVEPILHANTVTVSIRLFSLWRGRLEIDKISVDEASLNLVRTPEGRWNLDSLFRTAAAKAQPAAGGQNSQKNVKLPYLEATSSRINFKDGIEKLPFSLMDTDLSFWQETPGEWRIRLRGQPARTDVSLNMADTGEVHLDASLRNAPQLRDMPLHLDLDWQDAQLGQLNRLLLGTDSGWRGDLRGELHLDGTAEVAHIKARLRANGVHRAEFAPVAPLDFDANCGFLYHFSTRSVESLLCESPLGDGRIRFSGDLPGDGHAPKLSVELDRIPAQAALDALRTVRSDFGPGLEAKGAISGKIAYAEIVPESIAPEPLAVNSRLGKMHPAKSPAPKTAPKAALGPLSGSLLVDGFQLSGNGLSEPILIPKLLLEPAATLPDAPAAPSALAATLSFSRWRQCAAHHHLAAGALWLSARCARLAFDGAGQGTGSRSRSLECHPARFPGRRSNDGGFNRSRTLDFSR